MENINDAIEYRNIESIIVALDGKSKYVTNLRKFDGITIECTTTSDKRENAMNEMQALSKKLGLMPVSVEARKDSADLFGLQYPDLKPLYTEAEVKRMYYDNFEFLFNNIKMKDPKSITRNILISNIDRLTKHAITTYCRSNINQYKESIDDYINNTKYRAKINGWYLEYIDIYLAKTM